MGKCVYIHVKSGDERDAVLWAEQNPNKKNNYLKMGGEKLIHKTGKAVSLRDCDLDVVPH